MVVHQRAGQAGESAGAVLPQEPPDGGEQGRHHAAVHHCQSRAAAGAQQVPGERSARPGRLPHGTDLDGPQERVPSTVGGRAGFLPDDNAACVS